MSDLDLIYKPKKSAPAAPPAEERKKERILSSKQVSKNARKQGSTQESREVLESATIEARLIVSLQNPTLKANTFRYTQQELDFIRDIVYEAETKHGVKLDKNDIARLGLDWLMEDWKERKQDSLLARILTSKKARK
jgi:hypothetical protein